MLETGGEAKMLSRFTSADVGPEAKEYNLLRADEEYRNDNVEHSIYYQVKAQFQSTDLRYLTEAAELENQRPTTEELIKSASSQEKKDYKKNKFLQNIIKYLKQKELDKPPEKPTKETLEYLDFLEDIQDPEAGLTRISDVCHSLPQEWCVLQLCKSFNPATTYSVFNEIIASNGAIYLTLLRHCRSPELGPICLRFSGDELANLFREYSTLVERFRRVVTVDPLNMKGKEAKQKYWEELNAFDTFLQKLLSDFRNIISPYCYLFFGKRYDCTAVQQQIKIINTQVDDFCLVNQWSSHQRVLLSQAALHANRLNAADLKLICYELTRNENEIQSVYDMLKGLANDWTQVEERQPLAGRRFPTILVVDERLDHLHWEQLVTVQEFSRVKSLHCLWRLYQNNKSSIKHGYYTTNIKQGMCIINPDADLVNSGRRMRSFFEYWLSQWQHLFQTVPTEEVMVKQALQADCFVYAGHGSGLQYVNGRVICRARVRSVVFLFGCDSTRMLGTGLYSALYGAHDYYHGALCPSIVGTLMPALDGNMDTVSVTILSLWLAPGDKKVMPWTHIDRVSWLKTGIIKGKEEKTPTMDDQPNYHIGSLCSILSLVQQGKVEPNIYNCCIYVCRGLPAWNMAVEKMPL
ncbi:separin isoform X2 [Drosophila eugracilis]|uniref:separin isoform X2 n=1 Tax=Drosophila eugracilis TaxID=29029 RepID=UPI0007E711D6|nr:separin isoform X2 [Drosophila eugracilis]